MVPGQTLVIVAVSPDPDRRVVPAPRAHLYGKALRATAMAPVGVRLMGISVAGRQAHLFLAGLYQPLPGELDRAPITTVYYDTAFLAAEALVAAIIGGLGSYSAGRAKGSAGRPAESFSSGPAPKRSRLHP